MRLKVCRNCRFSDTTKVQVNVGRDDVTHVHKRQCQRHPPSTWAFVENTDWCGDWEVEFEPNTVDVPRLESLSYQAEQDRQTEEAMERADDLRPCGAMDAMIQHAYCRLPTDHGGEHQMVHPGEEGW